MKKTTKQKGVVKEKKRTRIQAVLATQTVQRCANKLAKGGKEDRERERGRGRERECTKEENVISLFNIGIYIYFSSFYYSYAIERRRETTTFESKEKMNIR